MKKISLNEKLNNGKNSNWSYWSNGDVSIGSYHGKSNALGVSLEKPKDIFTSSFEVVVNTNHAYS
mgnify:CR=1 FL=1